MLLKSRLSVLLAVAALPLAACGDSGSGSGDPGADPAKIVPADAPLYIEAVVRPDGALKTGANDALKKLLRTDDPGAKIVALFDKAAASGANKVTWADLKDWLGPRVGVYLSKFGGSETVGAVVADTTDTAKAKAGIDKIVKASTGDVTSAMVGDYAVVGSSAGVKAVQA
ncbi:MAG: hypothetical protein JWM73_936, partial [Solirubrobacterales bacterium]|nr:hypothetical protein [Solirubrobacterales bacterium]